MRVERFQSQDIADRRDMDVDQIEEIDRPDPGLVRIGQDFAQRHRDQRRKIARHDRQHEGGEKALHRPCAQMMADGLAVDRLAGRNQPAAEGVAPVARFNHAAVEPQHIGHRGEQQPRSDGFEQIHRKGVIALPIIAHRRIDQRDQPPGRPHSGQLGQADVERLAPRTALRPVDPGRRIAMHLVDEDRPQNHRSATGKHTRDRRIRPVHRPPRPPVDTEEGRNVGREARDKQITHQTGEPDDTHPGADGRTRPDARRGDRSACRFVRVG